MAKHEDPKSPRPRPIEPDKPSQDSNQESGGAHAKPKSE